LVCHLFGLSSFLFVIPQGSAVAFAVVFALAVAVAVLFVIPQGSAVALAPAVADAPKTGPAINPSINNPTLYSHAHPIPTNQVNLYP
jgi:hypothetical protein